MTRHQYDAAGLIAASAAPRFLLPDGTLWSHAAVLGDFVKGSEFSITPDVVRSMAANLASGYPQRVPMDYDHASTSSDPVAREARYAGNAPKAGTVLEARAVLHPADYPDTAAAQVEAAGMDPEQGFGLWVRWKPTARALQYVLAGEYTELSVCFDDAVDDKHGRPQGPTLLAVALLNRPFLDTLTPVAASADAEHTHRRADDPPPADATRDDVATTAGGDARHSQRGTMSDELTSLSAALSKPVTEATRSDAIRELAANAGAMRVDAESYRTLGALIPGATVDAKAAHVRELTSTVARITASEAEAKQQAVELTADGIVAKHSDRLTPANTPRYRARLVRELSAGVAAGETEAEQDIADLTPHGLTAQKSAGDQAATAPRPDEQIAQRAAELMASDAECKELAARNPNAAYLRAVSMAGRELAAGSLTLTT